MATAKPKLAEQPRPELRASDLLSALNVHRRAVDRRAEISILGCVRLVSEKGLLTIASTDLDVLLESFVHFDGPRFATCVNHAALSDVMAAFGDECPAFTPTADKLTVSGPAGTFTLAALPASEFQQMRAPDTKATEICLNRVVVDDALETCLPAVSKEETRFYLCGVHLAPADGGIEWVATDGHRIHLVKTPLDEQLAPEAGVTIPTNTVKLIASILAATDEVAVRFEFFDPKACRIRISIGDYCLLAKLIDGTYPDYRRIVPVSTPGSLEVSAGDLMKPLRAIERMPKRSGERRHCRLQPKDGLLLYANPSDGLRFEKAIEGAANGDLPPEIGFQAGYMLAALDARPSRKAVIKFNGACDPMVIEFVDDPSFRAVVMPSRL